MSLFSLFRKNIDTTIFAVAAFTVVVLLTNHGGIGISPDSVAYISAARSIASFRTIMQYDNTPFILFPLGYPFFLTLLLWLTHIDIVQLAPFINGGLFALLIFLAGTIIDHFRYFNKFYKWIILTILVTSPALWDVYSMLWSETLFIPWILLFFIYLEKYIQQQNLKQLLIVSLLAATGCIIRYAGIVLIGTGGIMMLFLSQDIRKKIKHILLFTFISSSFLCINLIRNHYAAGSLTGMRQKGVTTLYTNTEYAGSVISNWLQLYSLSHTTQFFIGTTFIIVSIASAAIYIFKKKHYTSFENVAVTFFFVYTAFILASATLSRFETINNRLLAPAYVSFIWFYSYKIPWAVEQISKTKRLFFIITVGLASAFLIFQQIKYAKDTLQEVNEGGIGGYTEDDWRTSPLLQYLNKDKVLFHSQIPVYSNASHAVYFYTLQQIPSLPERAHTDMVASFYRVPTFILIWFNNEENYDLLTLEEIAKKKKMVPLQTFSDGTIFLCTSDTSSLKRK
ncbi:MAG: hypothetical protein KGO81_07390 [Bacteroidota bacterium]|nr:hypothetical protein [Bacteroidota bacterium]